MWEVENKTRKIIKEAKKKTKKANEEKEEVTAHSTAQ